MVHRCHSVAGLSAKCMQGNGLSPANPSDTKAPEQLFEDQMRARNTFTLAIMAVAILSAPACSRLGFSPAPPPGDDDTFPQENRRQAGNEIAFDDERSSIWDLFSAGSDPNVTVEVNKYIWAAALDVLDFMPIQAADPFSGVIVYGFGTPPGSGRAYRATVYVQDPALDARSLRVALATRSGPASNETVRAVEDAILTRARQLRIRDGDL